uniref:Proapoptotic nucleolar protein 1 n=1 Tax=Macaca nemestrina TaxID=9545 RepID=A0A2K6CTJ8_MACNE
MGVRLRVWLAAPPFNLPLSPSSWGGAFYPAGWRVPEGVSNLAMPRPEDKGEAGGCSLHSEAGSGPCPTAGARPTALSSAWPPRLGPRTCPQMYGEIPHVRPTWLGLSSLDSGPRHPPWGTRVCGSAPARPLTPGQPRIRASAGPGPPVPPARPRCSGSCHLPRPPRDLSPPQPGRTRMGAEGNRR